MARHTNKPTISTPGPIHVSEPSLAAQQKDNARAQIFQYVVASKKATGRATNRSAGARQKMKKAGLPSATSPRRSR